MRRVPVLPTILVVAACAAMIALGVWQLQRREEKIAAIARATANLTRPPIALPAFGRIDETLLFRRVAAFCLQPTAWRTEAGRTAGGASGWRHIALCRTGAEGPGFAADVGVSRETGNPRWNGGEVRGRLTTAPDDMPLIVRMFGRTTSPPTPMIVSVAAAPGLEASAQPDPAAIPNNHFGYAIQWFLFAGVAAMIYAIALWRRRARGS